MARKTPKQQQRHDEDSHDETLEQPYLGSRACWKKLDDDQMEEPVKQYHVEVARAEGRCDMLKMCIAEIRRFVDESDSHGTIWERVLTKRLEAFL